MGNELATRICPYLEVRGFQTIKTPKIKRICPNHRRQTKDVYCSLCGQKIIESEYVEEKTITPHDFYYSLEEFNSDNLMVPNGFDSIFLPNKYVPNEIDTNKDGGVVDLTDMTHTINEQMIWFATEHEKEIYFFKNTFGNENVKIRWGIVSYWC